MSEGQAASDSKQDCGPSALFRSILVPVDLTEKNASALAIAEDLAKRNEGDLTLLHVIETIEESGFDRDELEEFYRRLEDKARKGLEDLAAKVADEVPVHQAVIYGRRARSIVQWAQEKGKDLIVIGSHSMDTSEHRDAWLTISYQVAMLATCPVLLIK